MRVLLSFISTARSEPDIGPAILSERRAEVAALRALRITDYAPPIPREAWQQAAGGKIVTGIAVVEGHKARAGWGVAVLPVEIGMLWSGISDVGSHRSLPGLSHVEVVSGEPCADFRRVMMVMPLPIVSDRWWVVESRSNIALAAQTDGHVRELIWTGVTDPLSESISAEGRAHIEDAVAVTFNHGAWLLIGLDREHTMVEYFSWSDPGGELPAGPTSAFTASAIADTITAMGRYAAGGQSPCP